MIARSQRTLVAASVLMALLFFSVEAWSASGYGKLSGLVLDPAGIPQMGATVWLSPEGVGDAVTQQLTDHNGVFGSPRLRPGLYSVRVTLAGFLPAINQHISVRADLITAVRIELESVFASLGELRRPPAQPSESDDWKWVLRSAAATRPILQWRDGTVIVVAAGGRPADDAQPQEAHVRIEMATAGHPVGSTSNSSFSPTTTVSYNQPLGAAGRLLLAGQMRYGLMAESDLTLASIWVPSGEYGRGPQTTVVMRQQKTLRQPESPPLRQLRIEHTEQMAFGNQVVIDYGAEYLMAEVQSMTSSLRPRGRIIVGVSPNWIAAFFVETEPGAYALRQRESSLEAALEALDTLPVRVWQKDGRSAIEGGWHKEFALRRDIGSRRSLEMATFHDFSKHRAVFAFDSIPDCDTSLEQCSSSWAYAHDAGAGGSWGTRLVYKEEISDRLEVAAVYALAQALAPEAEPVPGSEPGATLRNKNRHSIAGRVSSELPGVSTKLSASYKWLSGPVVSRQDVFGEAALGIDPNLSFTVRHPLPSFLTTGQWEALADFRNVLAQGYVTTEGPEGRIVYAPVLRSFRGGVSFQF